MSLRVNWFLSACVAALAAMRSLTTVPVRTDVDAGVEAWERGDYPTAYRNWQPLAEQGDSQAQYNLGTWYFHVEQNYEKAANVFLKAAQHVHTSAQHDLGSLHTQGLGVPQSDTDAAKWFRLAAEQGHPMAQYNLGASYYSGEGVPKDYIRAADLFWKAAAAGIPAAQNNLGSMYYQGRGVQQDFQQAVKYFRLAADQSVAEAFRKLGAYQEGRLGRKFPILAGKASPTIETHREGLTYAVALAQASLGEMYAQGRGVRRDYIQAHKWYNIAAATHSSDTLRKQSAKASDKLAKRMTPDQIAEAQRMAREWLERH